MLTGSLGSVGADSEDLLYVSITAALMNTFIQLNKMILEAKELDEDILDYLYWLTLNRLSRFSVDELNLHEWTI